MRFARIQPLAMTAALLLAAGPVEAADLVVSVPGLEAKGALVLALFDSEGGWRSRKNPVREAVLPLAQAGGRTTFKDLAPGRYAVMAYHDRNGDGRLNTLPVGLPTEPYGFSNGARGRFGPPSWSAAAFNLPASGASQELRLK